MNDSFLKLHLLTRWCSWQNNKPSKFPIMGLEKYRRNNKGPVNLLEGKWWPLWAITRVSYCCSKYHRTVNLYISLIPFTLSTVRELISGPSLGTRAKFLTFNRIQSRAVTGLLMGHNTLRRHLHLVGLLDSPLCRKCGVREETSAHILCECEALASLRHVYLGTFFLEPEDIRSLGLGAIWNFSKATGLPWFDMGHKGPA